MDLLLPDAWLPDARLPDARLPDARLPDARLTDGTGSAARRLTSPPPMAASPASDEFSL
jgi:hypothetical protein